MTWNLKVSSMPYSWVCVALLHINLSETFLHRWSQPNTCTELVEQHRNPKLSVIVQRYNFNNKMKQPAETIAAYTAELCKITEHCSFGDTLDDMLRDCIVCRINDIVLQRQLLAEPDLTYQTALKMVQAWETAESNSRELQKPQGSNLPVHRVSRVTLKQASHSDSFY